MLNAQINQGCCVAYQKAVKEKKFALGLSESKKDRDFYLTKVAESKKYAAISERKRKVRSTQWLMFSILVL